MTDRRRQILRQNILKEDITNQDVETSLQALLVKKESYVSKMTDDKLEAVLRKN
jgi:hypothetical protein